MIATQTKTVTYLEWLSIYYQYEGTEDEVEKEILDVNRRMVDEIFMEEWCLSHRSAQLYVLKQFEQEYLEDCKKNGWQRQTDKFWWENN